MAEHDAPLASPPAAPAELAQLLAGLRRRFAEQLGERLQAIGSQLQQLARSGVAAVDLPALHREVHGLTGAAGTFGLPEVSQRSRALELPLAALLRGETSPDASTLEALRRALADLVAAACGDHADAATADPVSAPPSPGAGLPIVFHHGNSEPAATAWVDVLRQAGYPVEPVADLPALCAAWSATPPPVGTVLLLDLPAPGSVPAVLDHLRGLAVEQGQPLVVATLQEEDLLQRLQLARAGVRRTLARPLDAARLVEQLDVLTGRRPDQPYRVLLVDDDPLLLQAQAAVLRSAG